MDNESCALTHELLNPTFTREEKVEIHKLQRTKLVYAHELRVFFNQFRDYCDDEEFHALLCPNSKKTIDKCVGRFLRQIHQINSFRAYHQFVSQTRRTLVLRVRELAAIYPKSADVNQIA